MQTVEKYIDVLTEKDLQKLTRSYEGPCFSLYMPAERAGREIDQNPIRFKNLLGQATAKLKAYGLNPKEIDKFLASVEPVTNIDTHKFWRYQSDGLAAFVASEFYAFYRLPKRFKPQVLVGDSFDIVPLLSLVGDDNVFYILVLDQGGIRLLEGNRYHIGEIELDDEVPQNLAEALHYDVFERHIQFHTGTDAAAVSGNRRAMFHGHGTAANDAVQKENILRFFQTLDNGVCDLLGSRQVPLVLAGADHLRGLYRQANHYEHLVDTDIDVSAQSLDDEGLQRHAWAIVEAHFEEVHQNAIGQYQHLAGTGDERAVSRLEKIVPAAHYQRVETLFIPVGQQQWGKFDQQNNQVIQHDSPQPGDYDLVNDAAIHTIRNGGTVYIIEPESIPSQNTPAAILRY